MSKEPYAKEDRQLWKELMRAKNYDETMRLAQQRGLLHQDQRSAKAARQVLKVKPSRDQG
jgi:hypothetical protein